MKKEKNKLIIKCKSGTFSHTKGEIRIFPISNGGYGMVVENYTPRCPTCKMSPEIYYGSVFLTKKQFEKIRKFR